MISLAFGTSPNENEHQKTHGNHCSRHQKYQKAHGYGYWCWHPTVTSNSTQVRNGTVSQGDITHVFSNSTLHTNCPDFRVRHAPPHTTSKNVFEGSHIWNATCVVIDAITGQFTGHFDDKNRQNTKV